MMKTILSVCKIPEVSQKDWQGNEIDTIAYYQGMKIALFDVIM